MMIINNAFEFGEIVYLKTDKDQYPRIVTGFTVNPNGILYRLGVMHIESTHYELEITKEKQYYV